MLRLSLLVIKPILAVFLFLFFFCLLFVVAFTVPIRIVSKRYSGMIIGCYNRIFTRLCIYIIKIGNSRAIEVDLNSKLKSNSSVIMVSNHICSIDTVLLAMVSNYLEKTPKFISKDNLRWIPILGWGMYLSDYLFIKRDWKVDRDRIKNWCMNQKIGTSLIIYPEGSRFTEKKRDRSVEYSKKNNLPVFKNVLYPRIKGFNQCISYLQNPPFSTVVNVTILYLVDNKWTNPPSLLYCLTRRVPGVFKIVIEKTEIEEDMKEDKYLIGIFKDKDRLIEGYKGSR